MLIVTLRSPGQLSHVCVCVRVTTVHCAYASIYLWCVDWNATITATEAEAAAETAVAQASQ